MKFRTDFVTNSSSSSYCVSLGISSTSVKDLKLNFWPSWEDGSNPIRIGPVLCSSDGRLGCD